MNNTKKLFLSLITAIFIFSLSTIKAETENLLFVSDKSIKRALAFAGINLDKRWKNIFSWGGTLNEKKRAQLESDIKHAFTPTPNDALIQFAPAKNSLEAALALCHFFKINDRRKGMYNENLFNIHQNENVYSLAALKKYIAENLCKYISSQAIKERLAKNSVATRSSIYCCLQFQLNEDNKLGIVPQAKDDLSAYRKEYDQQKMKKWLKQGKSLRKGNFSYFWCATVGAVVISAGAYGLGYVGPEHFEILTEFGAPYVDYTSQLAKECVHDLNQLLIDLNL